VRKPDRLAGGIVALTVGLLLAFGSLHGWAEEEPPYPVERKPEPVTKNEKIDKNDEEIVAPEHLVIAGGNITITSRTFEPPEKEKGGRFKSFGTTHVDIHEDDPPDGLSRYVVPPTATNDTETRIKVEAVGLEADAALWPLRCEGNLDPGGSGGGGGGPQEWHWSAKMAKIKVDLDIDGMDEEAEDNPGAVVVRNFDGNNALRKKIILRAAEGASYGDKQVLTRASDKVKVFTAATGGTEIMFNGGDNEFEATESKDLYVEGSEASEKMGDVTLKLVLKSNPDMCDEVTFTVLLVTVTTDHTGSLENDNAARDFYSSLVVPPPSFALGHHLFRRMVPADQQAGWNGRGSEFIGTVAPSNFEPQNFGGEFKFMRNIVLCKDYFNSGPGAYRTWENQADPIGTDAVDLEPQSGGSQGVIYDVDAPGLEAMWNLQDNTIFRRRGNYKEWAEYDGVRCSEKKEWYTRQSYKITDGWQRGTATSGGANTLTDTNQSWQPDNKWVPGVIEIYEGTGAGQVRRITGSTSNTITVDTNWVTQPDSSSKYHLINTSTWKVENSEGITGDNQNGDGTTNTTWDLK